jgi:hypothetical protein
MKGDVKHRDVPPPAAAPLRGTPPADTGTSPAELLAHRQTLVQTEGVRQAAVAAASTAATVRDAEIARYRACLASAIANNCSTEPFVRALQQLGTGGS